MSKQIEHVKNMLFLFSMLRCVLFVGVFELLRWVVSSDHQTGDFIWAFILLLTGYFANQVISPYTGFHLFRTKQINSPDEFIPLSETFIRSPSRELSGYEYEELIKSESSLSPLGKEKLSKIKSQGVITEYDLVNLWFFEEQIGKLFEDDDLKVKIKGTFK